MTHCWVAHLFRLWQLRSNINVPIIYSCQNATQSTFKKGLEVIWVYSDALYICDRSSVINIPSRLVFKWETDTKFSEAFFQHGSHRFDPRSKLNKRSRRRAMWKPNNEKAHFYANATTSQFYQGRVQVQWCVTWSQSYITPTAWRCVRDAHSPPTLIMLQNNRCCFGCTTCLLWKSL